MKFGLLLYPGVEPIDLATIGVVSMARRVFPELSYLTVAPTLALSRLANGLRVAPDHRFDDCPPLDVLIVPGGPGWVAAAADEATLRFVTARASSTLLVSVCTGAMILAAAGVLDGRPATTKQQVVEPEAPPLAVMAHAHPSVSATSALLVDDGQVITGGGVSLCIDTLLHLLATRLDAAKTAEVARILEYTHASAANRTRLPVVTSEAGSRTTTTCSTPH